MNRSHRGLGHCSSLSVAGQVAAGTSCMSCCVVLCCVVWWRYYMLEFIENRKGQHMAYKAENRER